MGVKTITLGVFADNPSALKCYQLVGFKITGEDSYMIDGEKWKGYEMKYVNYIQKAICTGHMVTVVTVTVFLWTLGLVGGCIKVRREKARIKLSLAYTQTIACLYANDCATILKLKRFSKR